MLGLTEDHEATCVTSVPLLEGPDNVAVSCTFWPATAGDVGHNTVNVVCLGGGAGPAGEPQPARIAATKTKNSRNMARGLKAGATKNAPIALKSISGVEPHGITKQTRADSSGFGGVEDRLGAPGKQPAPS